jgi:hypothetical protein
MSALVRCLTQWVAGRTGGYAQLRAAAQRFGTIEQFVRQSVPRLKK